MNGIIHANIMLLLLVLCFSLSCDRNDAREGRGDPEAADGNHGAGRGEAGVLYRGHLPSRAAVDAVPWTSPTRNGSNTVFIQGSVGKVDIRFEEGERLDVTAQTVAFLQQDGDLAQVDVALVDMDKGEAADAIDRLATAWDMDKTRLARWKEAGKPDFPRTGFFLEKTRPLHFTTIEIGPSYDTEKPYVVHFNYGWKSQKDLKRIEQGR